MAKRKHAANNPQFKISSDTRRVIEYWRDSLLYSGRGDIVGKGRRDGLAEFPREDVEAGRCSPGVFRDLERMQARNTDTGRKRPERSEGSAIAVLICPLRFRRVDFEGPGARIFETLWIPAQLSSNGDLSRAQRGAPWIPRDVLESTSGDLPAIGTLDDLKAFAVSNEPPESGSWREYFRYAEKLFLGVSGAKLWDLEIEGCERVNNAIAVVDPGSGSFKDHVKLLGEILNGRRSAGLLERLGRTSDPARRVFAQRSPLLAPFSPSRDSMPRHSGHFTPQYPLARSQSLAVQRYLQTPRGSFLPVTGPPGTGKTTLIQSVVASHFVNSVRFSDSAPPVIVCTGATNQSVTNVIDCFGRASSDHPLAGRWIPGVKSYGTFCVSKSREISAEAYQLERRDGSGFSAEIERWEFLRDGESEFLKRFAACGYFPKGASTAAKAINALRVKIEEKRRELRREIAKVRGGSLAWLTSPLLGSPRITLREELAALAHLDQTLRHELFLLATHYWEGRWLADTSKELAQRKKSARGEPEFRGFSEEWRRRAMLTPAFVATLAMVPRFFLSNPKTGVPPIDLLIFDEAGQIAAERGGALAAMTHRALVIGDPLQLEPMWDVPPHVDRGNAAVFDLARANDEKGWSKLEKRGLLASSGNFMQLALRSAEFEGDSIIGVFLSEHRRSVPELVAFANDLAYRGRLEPKRPALEKRVLPAFGYVHVQGMCERSGTSRLNVREARQIRAWLDANDAALRAFYGAQKLEDLVAVITPFAAQARELRNALGERYRRLIVGTVQSLQGAEVAVVVFSPACDQKTSEEMHMDRNVNLLNVAVTRARDSFIVIGDMAIFNPQGAKPSSVLARHLFAHEENELPRSNERPDDEIPATEQRRLITMEEHRDVLREAFLAARREIVIVSPTISINAIAADRVADRIMEARSRNVKVTIYTDELLDIQDGEVRPNSKAGRDALVAAGAELFILRRIHNKSLAVDDHTLVDGSFNWLSALRQTGNIHQKLEISFLQRGENVRSEIERLKQEMEYRIITPVLPPTDAQKMGLE